MTRALHRAALGCVVALACACVSGQGSEQAEVSPDSAELEPGGRPTCGPAPESAIATLQPSSASTDAPCGLTLELVDGLLTIRAIPSLSDGLASVAAGGGELLASGPIPEQCGQALEHCELWGVYDELGPVLLAAVRGHESEVPVQVYVGWADERRLGFAPCWYGLSSVADHTRIGPPWALAPFACDGRLALLPAARLPEATVEGPGEAVRAAAGHWTIAEDGSVAPSEASNDTDGCRPVFATLP